MSKIPPASEGKRAYRKYDWINLRTRFVAGSMTIQEFAAREGIERTIVARRAAKDGWLKEREEINRQVSKGIVEKTVRYRIRAEAEIDGRVHEGAVHLSSVISHIIEEAEGLTLADALRLKAAVEALEKAHRLARVTAHLPAEPAQVIDGLDPSKLSADEIRLLQRLVGKASGDVASAKVH